MNHSEEFKFWVPFYFKKGPLLVPSLLKIGSPWDCGTLNSELKKNTLYDQICPDVARNTVFHLTGDPLKFTCMEKTLLPHGSPFEGPGPHGDLFSFWVPISVLRSPFSLFRAPHQLHICFTSAPHQLKISSSSAQHQLFISSTSAPHQIHISSSSAPHQLKICSTSAQHQLNINSTSAPHQLKIS